MPEFPSWQSYWHFARSVATIARYVRPPETETFLQTVLATIGDRIREIRRGAIFWRAQLGHGWRPEDIDGENTEEFPAPHGPDRMKPILGKAAEGRANPKGIPYLYVSTDRDTAMAEVRPWLGSLISVGQFETSRGMRILDCSSPDDKRRFHLREPGPAEREKAVWADIDHAFSRPVTLSDQTADYAPTQVLAELFKQNGFDGIAYQSALGKGHNLAFFDLAAAELANCSLFELRNLVFGFEEAANPYFIQRQENPATKDGA